MADWFVSGAGYNTTKFPYSNRPWTPGEYMVPVFNDATANNEVARPVLWECTTGGSSTATPAWPASVTYDTTTVTQNGVVWLARKPDTWAKATLWIRHLSNNPGAAAGDRILCDAGNPSPVNVGNPFGTTYTFAAGTMAAPIQVLSVTPNGASGFSAVTTGFIEKVTSTAGSGMFIIGFVYMVGVELWWGSGVGGNQSLNLANTTGACWIKMVDCVLGLRQTGSSNYVFGGSGNNNTAQYVELVNTNIELNSVQHVIDSRCRVVWRGGTVIANAQPTTNGLFRCNSGVGLVDVYGVDMSGVNNTASLARWNTGNLQLTLHNCKIASGVPLVLGTPNGPHSGVVTLLNSDSADTNYRFQESSYAGNITVETTIVRTGGSTTPSGTAYSMQMESTNASFMYPLCPSEKLRRAVWNTTLSAMTPALETITDGVTLKEGEAWAEVEYLGTSGFPLGTFANDNGGSNVAFPSTTNQESSSASWSTGSIASPVKQKLKPSFTPQEAGPLLLYPVLAKPSTIVYVDAHKAA